QVIVFIVIFLVTQGLHLHCDVRRCAAAGTRFRMAWVPSAHRADTLFTSAKASRAAVHNEKFFSMPAAGEKKSRQCACW
ncbi:MAG: hypothetical protein KBT18_03090, partial [Comamonas sp.]|nr:hypothetical protein [Candidatus Comamonas equi]